MENTQGKFLVNWLHGLEHREMFFLFWGAMVFGFILMFVRHQNWRSTRNFREGGTGKIKSGSTDLVVADKKQALKKRD